MQKGKTTFKNLQKEKGFHLREKGIILQGLLRLGHLIIGNHFFASTVLPPMTCWFTRLGSICHFEAEGETRP